MLAGDRAWDWMQLTGQEALLDLLKPFPPDEMVAYPVGKLVNDPTVDAPEVLLPAGD